MGDPERLKAELAELKAKRTQLLEEIVHLAARMPETARLSNSVSNSVDLCVSVFELGRIFGPRPSRLRIAGTSFLRWQQPSQSVF